MTKRSDPQREPPLQIGRRGPRGSWDPFYAFEKIARDDGKPYKSPEPKAERELLALLGSNAALVVMSSVLVAVVVVLLALLVFRL
ncbi:MAG TPA: hypothetical protein VNW50_23950 [Streptosporangiaceae bacterium]|jgi:hypothetical protein|nr:hypothetical protein [Streptosporangiaceae bacterium]